MIRKLLCWLGWHEWKIKYNSYCESPSIYYSCHGCKCSDCSFYKVYTKECKHCGAIKR